MLLIGCNKHMTAVKIGRVKLGELLEYCPSKRPKLQTVLAVCPIIIVLEGPLHHADGQYDGLNENSFHKVIYLNTWSTVGGSVWEGLGGVTMLEKVCWGGGALRFQKLTPFPHVCLPPCRHAPCHDGHGL